MAANITADLNNTTSTQAVFAPAIPNIQEYTMAINTADQFRIDYDVWTLSGPPKSIEIAAHAHVRWLQKDCPFERVFEEWNACLNWRQYQSRIVDWYCALTSEMKGKHTPWFTDESATNFTQQIWHGIVLRAGAGSFEYVAMSQTEDPYKTQKSNRRIVGADRTNDEWYELLDEEFPFLGYEPINEDHWFPIAFESAKNALSERSARRVVPTVEEMIADPARAMDWFFSISESERIQYGPRISMSSDDDTLQDVVFFRDGHLCREFIEKKLGRHIHHYSAIDKFLRTRQGLPAERGKPSDYF